MSLSDGDARTQFTELFDAAYGTVVRYAAHHVGAAAAEDVAAETFLIAWRRRFDIPHDSTPWLIGVARNVLFQQYRFDRRWAALTAELEQRPSQDSGPDVQIQVVERHRVLSTLAALSEQDRELLILTGWDGFTPHQAAAVLGCTAATARVHLHRARRRFANLLDRADTQLPTERPAEQMPQRERP